MNKTFPDRYQQIDARNMQTLNFTIVYRRALEYILYPRKK